MFKSILFISFYSLQTFANPILKKADSYRTLNFSHSYQILIRDEKANDTSEFNVFVSKDDALAVQTVPGKSKDRKILMKSSELWMFTPNINRPIRINLAQRLAGDISNGDILRTNFADDYEAQEIKESNASADVLVYNLTKKTDNATYSKIKYYLQKGSFKPLKSIFYAASGKELKTAHYLLYKKILGQEIFTQVKIQDQTKGSSSTVSYSGHKKRNYPDSFFNKDAVVNF